jgi:hypothetical protein
MQTLTTHFVSFIWSNLNEQIRTDGHQITVLEKLTTGKRRNFLSFQAEKYSNSTESYVLILILLVRRMRETQNLV